MPVKEIIVALFFQTAMFSFRRVSAIAAVVVLRAGSVSGQSPANAAGRLVADTVHSAALEHSKYGDATSRPVLVYLPPSYASNSTRRYPVVYLLHGFGATEQSWVRGYSGFNIQRAMDSLVAAGAVREMILVMPNARDRLLGSFYTNSASEGGWDDFISTELVAYVDRKYRTLARPQSRGLGGHSMGGYGTLYLAMRHGGDVYGAAYALSACCTRFNTELTPGAEEVWARLAALSSLSEARDLTFVPSVYLALAAAFSPNPDRPPLYVDLPFEQRDGRWRKVDAVQAEWTEHSPYDMVPSHASHLKQLAGFAFDIGTRDELVAPFLLAQMDSAFTRAGVRHTFETYDGTHMSGIGERMIRRVLPFFSRTLEFDAPK